MKTFYIVIISLILVSCSDYNNKPKPYPKSQRENCEEKSVGIIELTIDNKTHQYVNYTNSKYNNGICHYPECKYCK